MSRAYDAKQEALKAHPDNREAGVDLFLGYLDASESDFRYDMGCSAAEYIYGKSLSDAEREHGLTVTNLGNFNPDGTRKDQRK